LRERASPLVLEDEELKVVELRAMEVGPLNAAARSVP
jgi:hypothetical protein